MSKTIIFLFAFIFATGVTALESGSRRLSQYPRTTNQASAVRDGTIKITIAAAGAWLSPPKERYRTGEQIPIDVSMTNTSNQPVDACVSSDLYQDLPRLTRDGQLVPYATGQADLLRTTVEEQTCQRYDLPEQVLLKSNEPTIVDWLFLEDDSSQPTGAQTWYDRLAPGVYELTIRRKLSCCDGPVVESNKISFEVVP